MLNYGPSLDTSGASDRGQFLKHSTLLDEVSQTGMQKNLGSEPDGELLTGQLQGQVSQMIHAEANKTQERFKTSPAITRDKFTEKCFYLDTKRNDSAKKCFY